MRYLALVALVIGVGGGFMAVDPWVLGVLAAILLAIVCYLAVRRRSRW